MMGFSKALVFRTLVDKVVNFNYVYVHHTDEEY